MKPLQRDFWFLRKQLGSRALVFSFLALGPMLYIINRAGALEVSVILVASLAISAALLTRALRENARYVLLPNFLARITMGVLLFFLLLSLLVYWPFAAAHNTEEAVKIFVLTFTVVLCVGFYRYLYTTAVLVFIAFIVAEILSYSQIKGYLQGPLAVLYGHSWLWVLLSLLCLAVYIVGLLAKPSRVAEQVSTVNMPYQTVSQSNWLSLKPQSSPYQLDEWQCAKASIVLFFIYLVSLETALYLFPHNHGPLIIAMILLFHTASAGVIPGFSASNLDRLWLASSAADKRSFLLKNVLSKQLTSSVAIFMAYVYSDIRDVEFAPLIWGYLVCHFLILSVCNLPLSKLLAYCSVIVLLAGALIIGFTQPVLIMLLVFMIWLLSVLAYASGDYFFTGRMHGAVFAEAES